MPADDERQDDLIRIRHMLDAAREAVTIGGTFSVKELEADRVRSLALTRCVEIVGEAAGSVSTAFREDHADVPWRIIIATRNRMIQAYFDIDLAVLADTVEHDLPGLIALLKGIAEVESA